MDAASTNRLAAAHRRRRQEAAAEVAVEGGVVGVGDGSGRTWHGGPPANDHMWVRPGAGFEADGVTPTTAHLARNPSLHEFAEGDPVTLEWMSSGRGANMLAIVHRRRTGTRALYWIGYDGIPAVWNVYRLLPDLVTIENLGKFPAFTDATNSSVGSMFTVAGALVITVGTLNVSTPAIWRDGPGWSAPPVPTLPGTASWGTRRNLRLGGDLYTIIGRTVSGSNSLYIWKLTLPDTWTLVVSQQCAEMTDLQCAWPVEPAVEGGDRYILLCTLSTDFDPGTHSEGRVFWRLRVPNDGEAVPLVDQHNPAFLMPLSTTPYNMSVARAPEVEWTGVWDGASPWFVGYGGVDHSVGPPELYPPIAARYDAASDTWFDQNMTWTLPAPADPPGEYWGDQGWSAGSADLFEAEGNAIGSLPDDAQFAGLTPVVNGWLYGTFDGGSYEGHAGIGGHTTLNTTLHTRSANAHSGPPLYTPTADEATPSKRLIRQRPGFAAEVLASFTLDGTNGYDTSFGFHGAAVAGDGTLLFGIGKGPMSSVPQLSEPHPEGPYGYPNGGVYYVHGSGAILAWPPLQHAFNGSETGVLRLYSSEDEV